MNIATGTIVDVLTQNGDVLISGAVVTGSFAGMIRMDWPNGETDKLVDPQYVKAAGLKFSLPENASSAYAAVVGVERDTFYEDEEAFAQIYVLWEGPGLPARTNALHPTTANIVESINMIISQIRDAAPSADVYTTYGWMDDSADD